ncbi:MAG: hypothetical protein II036_04465, partial [Oscillospiraceae bacterium]|nr:hypothetical protein [Oscillospiraceae bacterium]
PCLCTGRTAGCADLQKYYYGYAYQVSQGILVGEMYFSTKDIMEERTEEAKAAADYVTDGVERDGLYKAFAHLGLL